MIPSVLATIARRGSPGGVPTAPGVSPSFSLSPAAPTVSVAPSGTQDIMLTLVRGGGHTADVTLVVAGLPTGVAASFVDSDTFTGATTTRTVRLTGTVATPISNDAFTITGSSSGVSDFVVNALVTVTSTTPFFSDSFESGDLSHTEGGASWGGATRTAVVTTNPYTGTNSLRFRFEPDDLDSGTGEEWVEQHFLFGRSCHEVTVEYRLYVPSNFVHRYNANHNNNKFIMLWRDLYGSLKDQWQVGFEYWRINDTASMHRFLSSRWDEGYVSDYGSWPSPPPAQWEPFIGGTGPINIGAWNKIKMYAKGASSQTAEDGIVRLTINDTLSFEYTKGRFHNKDLALTDSVLKQGYLLGWSNSGFAERTDFYIDDVKFTEGEA